MFAVTDPEQLGLTTPDLGKSKSFLSGTPPGFTVAYTPSPHPPALSPMTPYIPPQARTQPESESPMRLGAQPGDFGAQFSSPARAEQWTAADGRVEAEPGLETESARVVGDEDELALPIWTPETAFDAHDDAVFEVQVFRDGAGRRAGSTLAMTAGLDGAIALWEVGTVDDPELRARFCGLDSLAAAVLDSQQTRIVTGSAGSAALAVYDVEVGDLVAAYDLSVSVQASLGSTSANAGSGSSAVSTFGIATGPGLYVSVGTLGGGLVWDPRVSTPVGALGPEPSAVAHDAWDLVRAVAMSADGTKVAMGGYGALCAYDLRDMLSPIFTSDAAHGDYVDCVAFDEAGANLVSSGRDGFVHIWSLGTEGETTPRTLNDALLPCADGQVLSTNFAIDSANGLLVVPSAPGSLLMYDLDDESVALRMNMHPPAGAVDPASFLRVALNTNPDRLRSGVQAITSDNDGYVYLWTQPA